MAQWLVIGISGVTCGGKTTLAHSLRDYFISQRNGLLWNNYAIGEVKLISQDDYFLPVDDLRHKWNLQLNAINFELLTSLDMKQMLMDIRSIMLGQRQSTTVAAVNKLHSTAVGGAGDHILDNMDYINEISMSPNFPHYSMQNPYGNHQTTFLPPNSNSYMRHSGSSGNSAHSNAHLAHRLSSHIALRDNKINILILEGFILFNQPELLNLCNIKYHFHLPYEKCYERRQQRTYDPPDVVGYFEMCVWPHYEQNFAEFKDRKDITFLNGELPKERIFKFVLQRIRNYFEERCDNTPPPQKLLSFPHHTNNNCSSSNSGKTVNMTKTSPMEQQ